MSEHLSPSYPVLPLRDIVVFPHMIVPLFVGREKSVRALEEVMSEDKQIQQSSQIDPSEDVKIDEYLENDAYFEARVSPLEEELGDETTVEALIRSVGQEFEKYAKIKKNIPDEALSAIEETTEPGKLVDLVSGHLGVEVDQKQDLLETLSVSERLEKVYGLMQGEMSVLQVE